MNRTAIALLTLLLAASVQAQDAVQTDADKYSVLLENECVRVLRYRDSPGQKTHQHRHPPFVLYALTPFSRSITLPDGKVLKREFKAGDVLWSEAQTHIGENTGTTPTEVIMVELKGKQAECGK
jgi:quercetin dioxygenase-like cupin family protein